MFKAVLLDLDGTVYRGRSPIPGAKEAIERLRREGVKVFFLTNASTKTREGSVNKLRDLGVEAKEEEIYSSSYAAAKYISDNFHGKSVYCICEGGMQGELEKRGEKVTDMPGAEVVAVGLDRNLTYDKLANAYRAIMAGAPFIASNDDPAFPVEDGFLPGAGAMVEALRKATGKNPVIMGKPNSYLIDIILEEHNLDKKDIVIVGDRLETDILTGKRMGITAVLVLSGVAKKEDVEKLDEKDRPDYILPSLAEIFTLPSGP